MKKILVTGATGGIGSRVCKRLTKNGDEIILVSRSKEKLNDLVSNLKNGSEQKLSACEADFANSESVKVFLQSLEKDVKSIDGLVLIYPAIPKSTEIIPAAETWRNSFEQCFIQPLECLKIVLKLMKQGSRVVIVSGIANVQVFPQLAMSNAIRSAWLAY